MTVSLSGPYPVWPQCRLWLAAASPDEPASVTDGDQTHLLAEARMSDEDLVRWKRFRSTLKQAQFLNSRIIVRRVLKAELGDEADAVSFLSDAAGQPRVLKNGGQPVGNISLSHSGQLIAVSYSGIEGQTGVDIEQIQQIRKSFFGMFATDDDMESVSSVFEQNADQTTLTAWVIKEAVWKSCGGPADLTAQNIFIRKGAAGLYAETGNATDEECRRIELKLFGTMSSQARPLDATPLTPYPILTSLPEFMGCVARPMT